MKKWNRPTVSNLTLSFTKEDFDFYNGNGNKLICPVCCKTSNPGSNGNQSFHKGHCIYFESNRQDILVSNNGSSTCRPS